VQVIFSPAAQRDLFDIAQRIAVDNPARAETFTDELRERCLDLANMPLAFQVIGRYRRLAIRRRPYRRYLIFYRTTKDVVEIVRVLHGARDYDGLLRMQPDRG
jgi:toxin ParE1/3/4